MKTHLLFDASNILQRTFFASWQMNGNREDVINLALHNAITTLNKYFNKFQPNNVICVFDRPNWRKVYTKSDLCISKQIYKGTRRQNMTPVEQMRYEEFLDHIAQFETFIKNYTYFISLAKEMLEADDIIAGYCEVYSEDRVIIISADKDLIQTMKFPNVVLIDPATDKVRECDDVNWFMFLKCFRGDRGDNVANAFPKVRETKLRIAYEDEFAFNNILNETWTNHLGTLMRVGDLYEENRLLMDLYNQPANIKKLIYECIDDGFKNRGKYDHMHFCKFCGKHNLVKMRERATDYIPLFTCGKNK